MKFLTGIKEILNGTHSFSAFKGSEWYSQIARSAAKFQYMVTREGPKN